MKIKIVLNKIKAIQSYFFWARQLWHPQKKCAYFFGIPTHSNIGDSAIVIAEKEFLRNCGYDEIVEITSSEYVYNRKCIKRLMPRHAHIFLPGGGNMGSLWPLEEERRYQIIEDFKNCAITVFPQTIFYGESDKDFKLKHKTEKLYNTVNQLTLVAREEVSYNIMKHIYHKCRVLLSPDIVLSMGQRSFKQRREGILICFRKDKEKKLDTAGENALFLYLKKTGYSVCMTDTMADDQITKDNRLEIVKNKMKQIASARLLITDRLHGMVFAAITGTPCIVFGNSHHKVVGTYKWLENLGYIKFVSEIEEAKDCISDLYNMENCEFSLDKDVFEELRQHIIQCDIRWR